MFHVEVFVGDEMIAQGVGRTKKEAEQEAAKLGLEAITNQDRIRIRNQIRNDHVPKHSTAVQFRSAGDR